MNKTTRVVIVGGLGRLGHIMSIIGSKQFELYSLSRRSVQLDKAPKLLSFSNHISNLGNFPSKEATQEITKIRPHFIINAIGSLNARAELSSLLQSNCECSIWLQDLAKSLDAWCINISSDAVYGFNNNASSETDSLAAYDTYSASKLIGEIHGPKTLNIRTSFIGPTVGMKNNNVSGLFNWAINSNEKLSGYKNIIWSGVTSLELAELILQIIKAPQEGIINISGQELCKYTLIKEIISVFNLQKTVAEDYSLSGDFTINSDKFQNVYNYSIKSQRAMLLSLKAHMKKHSEIYY